MTKRFAEELKAAMKCPACSRGSAPNRKFCRKHLVYARQKWHSHVSRCGAEGRCINCSSKKLSNEQRCSGCKTENKTSCLNWYYENKSRLQARYRERLARGLCGSCGLRRPVRDHTQCAKCHTNGYTR